MKPVRELMAIRHCLYLDSLDGGAWVVLSPIDDKELRIIASWGGGWDHVSVSRRNKVPSWREMEFVKRLFFKADETAMQLHVPPADHISYHPFCLHLWRPQRGEIPRPPSWMIVEPAKEETT